MKKILKNSIFIIFGLIFSILFVSSCRKENIVNGTVFSGLPEFSTRYTIEQHKERITRYFANDYFADDNQDVLADFPIEFYVDILYSFRNQPEFFLVEYKKSNWLTPMTRIGAIVNDNYYTISDNYICVDYSCYRKKGFLNNKKYFGKYDASEYNPGNKLEGVCAVEVNGELVGICGELENKVIDDTIIDKLLFMQWIETHLFIDEEKLSKYSSTIKPREEPLFFSPMADYSLTVDTIGQYLEKRGLNDRAYVTDDLYDKKGNQIYKLVEFEDDGYMIFDMSGSNPVLKDFSPNTASPYKKYEQANGKIITKKIYDPSNMLDRYKYYYGYPSVTLATPHLLDFRSSWGYEMSDGIQVISSEGTTTPFFWPEDRPTLIPFRDIE